MTIKSFRDILHRSRGPYVVRLASGGEVRIPHIDFVALPGPTAGAEEDEPLVAVYLPKGIEFIDLEHAVSVEIPRTRRAA